MKAIEIEQSDKIVNMLDASFDFWFNDNEHIRSPFPDNIKDNLQQQTIARFNQWVNNISDKAKDEINDEILVEKLEEIMFEIGLSLVNTDDEKITVQYPFMPRLGDLIKLKDVNKSEGESKVVAREIIKKEDTTLLKVSFLNLATNESWETEFELPE
ncbi:MAG: hypothetical protein L6Q66_06810 [Bacteroidia bacterium]|nr:hypothetical protein [Bacteroidia bacterium]